MGKLAILVAVLGLGYWYWSGPYQDSAGTSEASRLAENMSRMQRCIREEKRMDAAAGMAGIGGVGNSGADAERVCADKYNLYLLDGEWHDSGD